MADMAQQKVFASVFMPDNGPIAHGTQVGL
jgi:hypothetical protein